MQKLWLEAISNEQNSLAMFTVYIREGEALHPDNCFLDPNGVVTLKSIDIDFPHEDWVQTDFHHPDTTFTNCPGECVTITHDKLNK